MALNNSYYLSLRNISKNFDGVSAVRDVSLDIAAGEIIGLVGDNGAGKSTLVKMICGNLLPSSGNLLCEGNPVKIDSPAIARKLGIEIVHQDLALCGNLNASENIFLGRELRHFNSIWAPLKKSEMISQSKALIDMLQSDSDVDRPVQNMSGGQRQAVAISRTLLSSAQLIIMDEPLAAISVKQITEVLALIKNLKNEGKSVILITHRLDDVFSVCDRVVVMRRGEKVADRMIGEFSVNELTGLITGAL